MSTNPFQLLRKACDLQLIQFCGQFQFARQTIIAVEQGVYPKLSERMVLSLGQACYQKGVKAKDLLREGYGVGTLREAYEQWRRGERAANSEKLATVTPMDGTETHSPMYFFVKNSVGSVSGFSKVVKVDTPTITRYIAGTYRPAAPYLNMPLELSMALEDMQYPFLPELISRQQSWIEQYA